MINCLKSTIVAAALFIGASIYGQFSVPTTYGSASITADYCVSIDTTQPLQEYYQMDISHLNFATETDAKKVFGFISNNRLTYMVDFNNHVAYLRVHADRTPQPEDVIWWNNYIDSLCKN